ncbi:uncharacterized protein LOC131023110 [Salvia miltiorrhiza]|uniref:uncharacterized protein LOC131023110 n=1 Tax=Salvia miltiorrhiza TaxID=226208 RepID=UPI0025AD8715|nr:uncharacterized protein LOC131023110 [Salvia miltiorrhiza]
MRYVNPSLTEAELESAFDKDFMLWFGHYVIRPSNNDLNPYIKSLAAGPLTEIETYSGYFVNGYRFHTTDLDGERATVNSGVCIKGSVYGRDVQDFYGRLQEVCVLEYGGYPIKKTVLFKCEWFDLSARGTSIDTNFKLVSVNQTRKYQKYDPFVLASQAVQVEVSTAASNLTLHQPFQEEVVTITSTHTSVDIDPPILVHPLGGIVDIEDDDDPEDDDQPLTSDDDASNDDDSS